VSSAEPLATRQRRTSAGRQIPPTGEMQYHPAKGGKGKQHGCFSSFLDITRVNPTRSFKYFAEKGYCWFLQPFAMLFMQLQG
jgi:hypothetical protein